MQLPKFWCLFVVAIKW